MLNMAAIDKCYIDNYKDYLEFKNWIEDKTFITPRGNKIICKNILFDWDEESFKGGPIPIFNSPVYFDNWLYHNCPLEFIQNWLQDRYFRDGYSKGNKNDITKELKLPEYEPCTKVKIIKRGLGEKPWKCRNDYTNKKVGIWWVDVKSDCGFCWYNEDKDYWLLPDEEDVWTISTYHSKLSVKAIIRKILKVWKLPKGYTITLQGRISNDTWILKTK